MIAITITMVVAFTFVVSLFAMSFQQTSHSKQKQSFHYKEGSE
jgi:hypothetical protein